MNPEKKLENDAPLTLEEICVDVILLDWRGDKGQKSVDSFLKAGALRSRIRRLPCMEIPMAEAVEARPFLCCFGTMDLTPQTHDVVGIRLFVYGTLGRAEGLGFVRDMEHGFGLPSDPSGFMEDSWRTAGMLETEIEKKFPGLDFGMELGIRIGTGDDLVCLDPIVLRSLKGKEA